MLQLEDASRLEWIRTHDTELMATLRHVEVCKIERRHARPPEARPLRPWGRSTTPGAIDESLGITVIAACMSQTTGLASPLCICRDSDYYARRTVHNAHVGETLGPEAAAAETKGADAEPKGADAEPKAAAAAAAAAAAEPNTAQPADQPADAAAPKDEQAKSKSDTPDKQAEDPLQSLVPPAHQVPCPHPTGFICWRLDDADPKNLLDGRSVFRRYVSFVAIFVPAHVPVFAAFWCHLVCAVVFVCVHACRLPVT